MGAAFACTLIPDDCALGFACAPIQAGQGHRVRDLHRRKRHDGGYIDVLPRALA
jgi:hypothetical protein